MTTPRSALAAAVIAVLLALSACASGDPSDTAATQSTTTIERDACPDDGYPGGCRPATTTTVPRFTAAEQAFLDAFLVKHPDGANRYETGLEGLIQFEGVFPCNSIETPPAPGVDDYGSWERFVDGLWSTDPEATARNLDTLTLAASTLCPHKKPALDKAMADSRPNISSGEYLVGTEIPPGTWRTTGDISDCYWARNTQSGDIIANNFATSARDISVTVREGEIFETSRCGTWRLQ